MELIRLAIAPLVETATDVFPIILFLFAFQALVIRRPLPNLRRLLFGLALVVAGLGLFLIGLDLALFPLGRLMAEQLTAPAQLVGAADGPTAVHAWGAYMWVYVFALSIGFATTIAEPALLAVAMKAHNVSGGAIKVWGLRVAVALGVAVGVCLGCYRLVAGLPLHHFIMVGYVHRDRAIDHRARPGSCGDPAES